jgi:hypothetical protein
MRDVSVKTKAKDSNTTQIFALKETIGGRNDL